MSQVNKPLFELEPAVGAADMRALAKKVDFAVNGTLNRNGKSVGFVIVAFPLNDPSFTYHIGFGDKASKLAALRAAIAAMESTP